MNVRDLIPWGRSTTQPARREADQSPFLSLHREVNRLFDDFFRGFEVGPSGARAPSAFSGGWPSLEVSDDEKAIRITAELPGMGLDDVEVLLEDGVLTLRGEKRAQNEDSARHFSERFYGRFERRVQLGYEVEEDKVEAQFKNGVLTVTLPKSAKAQSRVRRIGIKG